MKNLLEKVCNKIVRHTQWYDQFWNGAQKFWNLRCFNLSVVNLGSNSGKYAFNYEGLDICGMNWALGPQSLVHDFNILKNYFSYLKSGATVIITLCPFSSLVSKYSKKHNLKYYTFLHPATIIGFKESERIKALKIKQNPIRQMPWQCIKHTLKENVKYLLCRKEARTNMEINSEMFINLWKKQFDIEDLDSPLSENHRKEQKNRAHLLNDMIEFCLERSLKPVLVIPPMHSSLSDKLTDIFRKNYIYSFIQDANKHNVPFLNYIDDKRLNQNCYFHNSLLLSDEGAKKFTQIVLKDLNLII